MQLLGRTWRCRWAPAIRVWWTNRHVGLLRVAVVLMILAAFYRLSNEFGRLLWESGKTGAIDLKFHHEVVRLWFTGMPVYGEVGTVYPPASFVVLWPFLGWLDVTPARWLWAITTVPALIWMMVLIVDASGAKTLAERAFVALIPLAMYASSATIGNGQFIVHLLPALVTGLLLLGRKRRSWGVDVASAALILVALTKPTVTAPFFWMVMFVPGRLRPALLVVLGYFVFSMFAMSYQPSGALSLIGDWLRMGLLGAATGAVSGGYANMHTWFTLMGLDGWNMVVSMVILGVLGLWTYRHRECDQWFLMGVVGIVARLWAYHRLYDDFLILLPMITLFRLAKWGRTAGGSDVMAGILLAIMWAAALAPARMLVSPPPWNVLFDASQTVIWVVTLIFLVSQAERGGMAKIDG